MRNPVPAFSPAQHPTHAFVKLFLVALIVSGCTLRKHQLPDTFDPQEVAFIHKVGTATINGQAFLTRRDGIVVYAAGKNVYLIPSGKYARARLNLIYKGLGRSYFLRGIEPESPGYLQNIKSTVADGEGRFTFAKLSAGSYHLVTTVHWYADDIQQGGSIHKKVTLKAGETTRVIMNGY